ncbi:MAG: SUMF1/EgtB/PvdO family nonheme iron enzyme [Polyangiales bacterium]
MLFQRDQTVELPLLLASACAGVTCSVDQRCVPATGACESANSAPVRPFVGVSASVDVPAAQDDVAAVDRDAPTVDVTDAGALDVAEDLVDAGPTDTGPVDGGPIDTGVRDAGAIDVGLRDAGAIDGGLRDAGAIDGGLRDAGAIDVGLRDAGTPTCPTGMVLIPAGGFDMGSTTGDPDERPVHRVDLSAYCIDRNEITVADYQTCFTTVGSGCSSPGTGGACNWIVGTRLSHPINCVTWTVRTFCQWRGGDLPTEAQWEYAARGSDGRTYPWGNAAPSSQLCWSGGGTSRTGTCALGMFASGDSPFGLRDMAGNVWEWTANWSGVYPARSVADPIGPSTGTSRVMRGGNWGYTNAHYMRATYRNYQPESFSHITVGFRCAAPVTLR